MLEPVKAYAEYYKDAFHENAESYFDSLVAEAHVPVEENRETAARYRKEDAAANAVGKKKRGLKILRGILIGVAVIAGIVSIVGFLNGAPLVGGLSLIGVALPLVLIFAVLNKKIKHLAEEEAKHRALADEAMKQALSQMEPLFSLFEKSATTALITKTVPLLKFDPHFLKERADLMKNRFGLPDGGADMSTLGLISGEIIGNPFLFERTLHMKMGMQTYSGSRTIHWVTYSRDSKGNTVTHHHTETLHAYVTEPKPFYHTEARLFYGNDAAPDLHFNHKPSHAEAMSPSKRRARVDAGMKKIRKKAAKNISAGFTEMGNAEFDVLFGAIDRDNEVDFRLLFTALAQKNMLTFTEPGATPFGDDFRFRKCGRLNVIESDHAKNFRLEPEIARYRSYDVDLSKKEFLDVNCSYFESLYFDFAPLLSIPLYQQHTSVTDAASEEGRAFSYRDAERMAYLVGEGNFAHPASRTPSILKTRVSGSDEEKADSVIVTAAGFRTVKRVAHESVFGGDGRWHTVAVPWLEYIPVSKETVMTMRDIDLCERDFAASGYGKESAAHAYVGDLFATLGKTFSLIDEKPGEKDDTPPDGEEIGEIVEEIREAVEDDPDDDDL